MFERLKRELNELKGRGALKSFSVSSPLDYPEVDFWGARVIDFTSWDYLGLSANPKIKRAAQVAIENDGVGVSSPRLSGGTRAVHLAVEDRLANFLGRKASLTFSSKNQAVFSLMTSILTEQDIVFVDEMSQAPVAEAAELVGATTVAVNCNAPDLQKVMEAELLKLRGAGRAVMFFESISPTLGTCQPIDNIVFILKKLGLSYIIDDTFALGILGLRGAASGERITTSDANCLGIVGAFGYGIPGVGGFIAGSQELISVVLSRTQSFCMEPSPPSSAAAVVEASLDFAEMASGVRVKLLDMAASVRSLVPTAISGIASLESPIISIPFAKPSLAETFSRGMLNRGILIDRVPRGTLRSQVSYARLVITALHSDSQIEKLKRALFENQNALG